MSRTPSADRPIEVEVTRIGSKGDGIADGPEGPVYLPYTVPGDRLSLKVGGSGAPEVIDRLSDGPHRQSPSCPHFGLCGGCALQHLESGAYTDWKRDQVVQALARRGLDAPVGAMIGVAPESRRRVRLSVRVTENATIVGYRQRRSHRTVDVDDCPVAAPPIARIIGPLRDVAGDIVPRRSNAEFVITALDGEVDLLVQAPNDPVLQVREHLGRFAEVHDLSRVSWMTPRGEAEPIAARRPVRARFGSVSVDLPPVPFLQPTDAGEAALRAEIEAAVDGAKRVADLFSGCGAFGLPLAATGAALYAADSDAAAIAALDKAARDAGFGARVNAERRHLGRRPLAEKELNGFDAVVLDPPRAGAQEQAELLAGCTVPVVAYASCNPATFARDARVLADGGYRLDHVTPVDQFLWSPHVELIGIFRR